jgi:hypothetical protein
MSKHVLEAGASNHQMFLFLPTLFDFSGLYLLVLLPLIHGCSLTIVCETDQPLSSNQAGHLQFPIAQLKLPDRGAEF